MTTTRKFMDGNYEPGRCALHTPEQQAAEARKKRYAVPATAA
jgi:hypothetical protein